MPIHLRGHHLLCLLGYRGMGYSEQFAANMSRVHEMLRKQPETPVRITHGPDDLCSCYPEGLAYHCNDGNILERDRLILERLRLEEGGELPWKEIEQRIAGLVEPEDIAQWCYTCSWRSLGYCQEGVQRVRNGQGLKPLPVNVHGVKVYGADVDKQTRCRHYHSPIDIIAIRFHCCDAYYSCYECHQETAGHSAAVWDRSRFGEKAILCGACGYQLTIREYMACHSSCPSCHAGFNPGCRNHYHLYFETGL